MVYNEINLGFCFLEVYTDENGVCAAKIKTKEDDDGDIVVPASSIYSEGVVE